MQFFYDIFPVLLFFLIFKFYGIYAATIAGIAATFLQTILTYFILKRWDKKQLITLVVFVIFGGLTLYFHNPIFVKWKPTIVFWIFSAIILISHLIMHKTIVERLMENLLQEKAIVPVTVWKKLNLIWGFFFLILGAINLYIAYFYSSDIWVNFKFYGITGALFLLSIFQAIYLLPYLSEQSKK